MSDWFARSPRSRRGDWSARSQRLSMGDWSARSRRLSMGDWRSTRWIDWPSMRRDDWLRASGTRRRPSLRLNLSSCKSLAAF